MKKLLGLLTLALGILVLTGCTKETVNDVDAPETTDEMNNEEFSSTIMDIYKKGGKMTCTMTYTEGAIAMKGTLYIDGKKMKSVIDGSAQGMEYGISALTLDGYSYTRNTMSNKGWKMVFEDEEIEDIEEGTVSNGNMESPMTFTCKKGIEDSTIFNIPSDIEFEELAY